MSDFKREKHNPLELIKNFWPDADSSHIKYDPSLKKGDFNIIRQSGGDGTLAFTLVMLQEGLLNIVNKSVFCTSKEPDWSKVKDVIYTLGDMKHVTVFGMIFLKCSKTHKYPGQRERTRMPVKCEFIY